MTNIDDKIREALNEEDADILAEFGTEQSLLEQVGHTFRTRARWLIVMCMIVGIVFMVLSVFCAIQFFKVESTRELIGWAIGFVFFMLAVSMMKVWYWMELNKNAVTREIKRVELQIARLATKIDGGR